MAGTRLVKRWVDSRGIIDRGNTVVDFRFEAVSGLDPEARKIEVVERKGLGHPDSICDRLAEAVSLELSRYYYQNCGAVLHHNVDKILLCGGSSQPRFGGGEISEPIEVYLAGRATSQAGDRKIPVCELAETAARRWLSSNVPLLVFGRDIRVHCVIRPGSSDLVGLFSKSSETQTFLSNDTSIGVGFAPLTRLEQLVLALEQSLNSAQAKARFPFAGTDVKVMGVRVDGDIRMTVACAFVDRFISNLQDYRDKKDELKSWLVSEATRFGATNTQVEVNAADDYTVNRLFLTVSGTSAESGDDGEVGRGNRMNGLITPGRTMTIEAMSGKNPVIHTGRLYQIAADEIARELIKGKFDIRAAECTLVSKIGQAIEDPQLLSLRLDAPEGISGAVAEAMKVLCCERLQGLKSYWMKELEQVKSGDV